jgi:hypothetical protein
MADQDKTNQAAGKDKAEGERWSSEQNSVRKADRDENPEQLYRDEDGDNAGGITNRPLPEEVGRQDSLPDRGTTRERTRNPDSTRRQGDYTGSEQ